MMCSCWSFLLLMLTKLILALGLCTQVCLRFECSAGSASLPIPNCQMHLSEVLGLNNFFLEKPLLIIYYIRALLQYNLVYFNITWFFHSVPQFQIFVCLSVLDYKFLMMECRLLWFTVTFQTSRSSLPMVGTHYFFV